jgi:hypothetical protein
MKDNMPGWPQTLSICAFGTLFCVLGYILSHRDRAWDAASWTIAGFLILIGLAFLSAIFVFYLRPQYGGKAVPAFILMLLGHGMLITLLWKTGMIGP